MDFKKLATQYKDELMNHILPFWLECSQDHEYGGYIEATTRDWQPIGDMRLSELDANYPKSQNTHLHILEPYTNLYRVWKDPRLEQALSRLIDVFLDKILNPVTHHLDLFGVDRP